MIKANFFIIAIIFNLYKYISPIPLNKGVTKHSLTLSNPEEINSLISNDLTHEKVSYPSNFSNTYDQYESNIFFIIGKENIKSLYFKSTPSLNYEITENLIDIKEELSSSSSSSPPPYDLYYNSSSYLFIPKNLLYVSTEGQPKSILFGLCTNKSFISSYIFDYDSSSFDTSQELIINNQISWSDLNIEKTDNKCSGSSFIDNLSLSDSLYISNAYSKYVNDNEVMNIHYEIKIFQYTIKTKELHYYISKSLKIEIINYSTTPPSNFNNNIKNDTNALLNNPRISLIQCRIINSFININQNDYQYDKEIIILCLYYSKDLVNSLANEPKFSIKLDLFKNNRNSYDLQLISTLTIKDSIELDNGIEYLYPSLMNYMNEKEIYIVLKGMKHSEIYTVELNVKTLILSNVAKLKGNFGYIDYETNIGLLLYANDYGHISFSIREFMGSFYIVRYDKDTNIISIFLYGDEYKDYNETEIKINIENLDITDNIIRIETSSISNVLLGILLITNNTDHVIFIQYPMCGSPKEIYKLYTGEAKTIAKEDLISSSIDEAHFNYIVDFISYFFSKNMGKIDFKEDYLSNEEKEQYLEINYESGNIGLSANKHIKNLKIVYDIYFEDGSSTSTGYINKFYSTTCSFLVDICHEYCETCSWFSYDDNSPRCLECSISNDFYPLKSDTSICKNKNQMPIEGYYFDEDEKKFIECHEDCAYCVGKNDSDCIKCNSNELNLNATGLQRKMINSKIYEFTNCMTCDPQSKWYVSNNFENGSVLACYNDLIKCPKPLYEYDNKCYQNCKNIGSEKMFGNDRSGECEDSCYNNYYYYENNSCVDECPADYYYELEYYCIKQCINNLYHLKEERKNYDQEIYFKLFCKSTCPINSSPYSFVDENNNKYCISNCSAFSYFYKEMETLYNIYYKNTFICRSKSQCNSFSDEFGDKKYVAKVEELSQNGEIIVKRQCLSECKEVGQYLLPQSFIDIEDTKPEGVDCVEECPEGYGNHSWKCIECSSINYTEYEKNCIKECPPNSFNISSYPNKCFSSCPEDYPYQDNYEHKCYKTLDEVPVHNEVFEDYCDRTKHLWYTIYNVNNVPIVKCLNDTDVSLTCAAVIPEYNYTNKINHECVKSCPDSYTIQNEHTKFCDFAPNKMFDFDLIKKALLTHRLRDNITKNESNVIIVERDYNSEKTITFYLFNYSNILEKISNGITPEVEVQETNGDIRSDPSSPFYYLNGTEIIISDQCEAFLRQSYNIPYYNVYNYQVENIQFINGLKVSTMETKQYYIPQYLLGVLMNINRDNTSQVEYKLYNPKNPSVELDLNLCYTLEDEKATTVTINVEKKFPSKIYNLYEEVYSYYSLNKDTAFEGKSSKKYDYDIFNRHSDFFVDPCSPFSSKYNADVLTVDRFKDYYVRVDFCETNCTYLGSRKSYKNLEGNYIQFSCQCPLKVQYNKEEDVFFKSVVEGDDEIDESTLSKKKREELEEKRILEYDINLQFLKTQLFRCFKKFINIKSIFSKENILGLLTLICFLLIIILYISQCMIGMSHILEVLKFIRLGKFNHGVNIFVTLKDYLKEINKREQCYRIRKESKKVIKEKENIKNETLVQTKHKIRRAEDNLKRKLEGKEMIDEDKKPDELELIRGRVKKLEEQLRKKYIKMGLKDKSVKVHIGKVNEE